MQSFAYFRNILSGKLLLRIVLSDNMDVTELVKRCRCGDEQAVSLLYTTYVHKLENVCRKYVKDESDVQDIVHDSIVIILTSLDRLKEPRKLESWMCTIVRNLSLKHARRLAMDDVAIVEITDAEDEADIYDYDKLMTLVEQLPTGYRKVLKLSVLEGLLHKEIGELLGIGPHSSSSQLARAKELVRKNAKRYGGLLLALLIVIVPLLLMHDKQGEDEIVEQHEPAIVGGEDNVADMVSTEVDDVQPVPRPKRLYAKHVDRQTVDTVITEVHDNDSTVEQQSDTAKTTPRTMPDDTPMVIPNDVFVAENVRVKKDDDAWGLSVSFTGGNGTDMMASAMLPGGYIDSDKDDPTDYMTPDTLSDTRTHHLMPITLGISLSKSLSPRWSIESGLRYTLLRSEITTVTSLSDNSLPPMIEKTTQRIHYIGIPLNVTYRLWRTPSLALYTSGGACADIPVGEGSPVLWSVSFGTGIQYRIAPNISLYAEPSINYYINADHGTPTIRAERPFEFTIPIGLRLSW